MLDQMDLYNFDAKPLGFTVYENDVWKNLNASKLTCNTIIMPCHTPHIKMYIVYTNNKSNTRNIIPENYSWIRVLMRQLVKRPCGGWVMLRREDVCFRIGVNIVIEEKLFFYLYA
jgi:hypothetical protein